MKSELIGDLGSVHGVGQILLVGEDEEKSITELILVQHALKLLTSLADTVAIVGIDNEDDTLSVLEVYLVQVGNKRLYRLASTSHRVVEDVEVVCGSGAQ